MAKIGGGGWRSNATPLNPTLITRHINNGIAHVNADTLCIGLIMIPSPCCIILLNLITYWKLSIDNIVSIYTFATDVIIWFWMAVVQCWHSLPCFNFHGIFNRQSSHSDLPLWYHINLIAFKYLDQRIYLEIILKL